MGLSQQALAAKCQRLGWDASREMINHIEMQVRLVRDYEVIALAAALNTSPENILPTKKEAFTRLAKEKTKKVEESD
jgi:transcriptional regulator with XRE-family HTH domain